MRSVARPLYGERSGPVLVPATAGISVPTDESAAATRSNSR